MTDPTPPNAPVTMEGPVCPLPLRHDEKIVLGHGSGGKMSHDLIGRLFIAPFGNPVLAGTNDAGVIDLNGATRLAVSTDSHVVWPLFFPGGDIGRLAVCGTVNDLAMMGATPLYLTVGFILEEGLDVSLLADVVVSMQSAAAEAGVQIIAGDTKVVQRGKADGLYINTAGVGVVPAECVISGDQARPGDVVILSGTVGDHGIAVLGARGELGFEADVVSDVAPLNNLVATMMAASENIHVLRDPTRGGVATTLNEIAQQSAVGIVLDETTIPIRPAVDAACEMLGFDPLYVANEGKLLAIVAAEDSQAVLDAMRQSPYGADAVAIGRVVESPAGRVLLKTSIGSTRVVDMLAGEMLPRIC
jgi:hydrogenase expression/formation protein HypE